MVVALGLSVADLRVRVKGEVGGGGGGGGGGARQSTAYLDLAAAGLRQ